VIASIARIHRRSRNVEHLEVFNTVAAVNHFQHCAPHFMYVWICQICAIHLSIHPSIHAPTLNIFIFIYIYTYIYDHKKMLLHSRAVAALCHLHITITTFFWLMSGIPARGWYRIEICWICWICYKKWASNMEGPSLIRLSFCVVKILATAVQFKEPKRTVYVLIEGGCGR